jgi:hypothetical protein
MAGAANPGQVHPVIAQVSICNGPTCSGSCPPDGQRKSIIPVDRARMIAAWKQQRLYGTVHLCFTGCLGCCAHAPVFAFSHAHGACLIGHGEAAALEVSLPRWGRKLANAGRWIDPDELAQDLKRFGKH